MTEKKMTRRTKIGSLVKHKDGMYANLKNKTDSGFKAYYANGVNTWILIPFSKCKEWTVLREGDWCK